MKKGIGYTALTTIFLVMLFQLGCACFPGIRCLTSDRRDNERIVGKYHGADQEDGFVVLKVTGKGLPPENAISKAEATLLSERAAIVDGYRKMAEKIKGFYLEAFTRLGKNSIDDDFVSVETSTWLRGVEIINITHDPIGITEADLRANIRIQSIYDNCLYHSCPSGKCDGYYDMSYNSK